MPDALESGQRVLGLALVAGPIVHVVEKIRGRIRPGVLGELPLVCSSHNGQTCSSASSGRAVQHYALPTSSGHEFRPEPRFIRHNLCVVTVSLR